MKRIFEKVKDFCVDNYVEIVGALVTAAVSSVALTGAYNIGKTKGSTFCFNINDEILTIKEIKEIKVK